MMVVYASGRSTPTISCTLRTLASCKRHKARRHASSNGGGTSRTVLGIYFSCAGVAGCSACLSLSANGELGGGANSGCGGGGGGGAGRGVATGAGLAMGAGLTIGAGLAIGAAGAGGTGFRYLSFFSAARSRAGL